jgi:hypothetical protein
MQKVGIKYRNIDQKNCFQNKKWWSPERCISHAIADVFLLFLMWLAIGALFVLYIYLFKFLKSIRYIEYAENNCVLTAY